MKKRKIDIALLSDINLGAEFCRANELLSYLSSIKANTLILNGLFISDSISDLNQLNKAHRKVLKRIQKMAKGETKVYLLGKTKKTSLSKLNISASSGFIFANELTLSLHVGQTWILPARQIAVMRRIPWLRYFAGFRDTSLFSFLFTPGKRREQPGVTIRSNSSNEDIRFTDLAIARNYDVLISSLWNHDGKQWNVTRQGKCHLINSGSWSGNLTSLEYAFKRWKIYKYSEDKLPAFFADEELKHMTIRTLLSNLGRSPRAGLL